MTSPFEGEVMNGVEGVGVGDFHWSGHFYWSRRPIPMFRKKSPKSSKPLENMGFHSNNNIIIMFIEGLKSKISHDWSRRPIPIKSPTPIIRPFITLPSSHGWDTSKWVSIPI